MHAYGENTFDTLILHMMGMHGQKRPHRAGLPPPAHPAPPARPPDAAAAALYARHTSADERGWGF